MIRETDQQCGRAENCRTEIGIGQQGRDVRLKNSGTRKKPSIRSGLLTLREESYVTTALSISELTNSTAKAPDSSPFRDLSQEPFCQLFVNFPVSRMPLPPGRCEAAQPSWYSPVPGHELAYQCK
jgi:hypothetical protein